jgi:hypothetical protein
MARAVRRRLALSIALAAVLAGGTAVALGANGSNRAVTLTHAHAHGARRHSRLRARREHLALRLLARSYLDISRHQLHTQLRRGETLAQIADATPGKSSTGLRTAILAAAKQRLDAKVAANTLAKGAESRRFARFESKLTARLSRSHAARALRPKSAA